MDSDTPYRFDSMRPYTNRLNSVQGYLSVQRYPGSRYNKTASSIITKQILLSCMTIIFTRTITPVLQCLLHSHGLSKTTSVATFVLPAAPLCLRYVHRGRAVAIIARRAFHSFHSQHSADESFPKFRLIPAHGSAHALAPSS